MKKLFIIAGLLCLAGIVAAQFSFVPPQKLHYAEQAIANLYVDSVDEDKLVEYAIKGMLEKLDPHSSYSDPEETREKNEPLEGNFSGIGITYNMVKDTLYVISTVANGPSQRAGILPGDRILMGGDSLLSGANKKTSQIQKILRGPKGTPIRLKVLRGNETIFFDLIRADIPIYSIDAAYMADPSTGYIAISRFAADTDKEFINALKKLKKQGMKNLIVDLTENGGGYLGSAVNVLSELLPKGAMAVYTEGLNSPQQKYYTKPAGSSPLFPDGRVVVMVDQYSASASEITSGAIQDWDRGLIVGRRTYGKGLVQKPIPFPDGSMMLLTVSHYYTPSGRDIQKPYTKGDEEAYRKDIVNRFEGGELMHADSVRVDSTKRTQTIYNYRPIYGGGGIMPDRFVPLDTTENTKYLRSLSSKGVMNRYVVNYIDKNRAQLLKQYKNDDAFVANFRITDPMLAEIRKMADDEKIEFNQEEWDRSLPLLRVLMKALIGRDLFEQQTYDKVFNPHNPIFIEALRLINSDEYDSLLGR